MILIAHEMKDSLANICINRQLLLIDEKHMQYGTNRLRSACHFHSIQLKGYQMEKKRCSFLFLLSDYYFFFEQAFFTFSLQQNAFNTKYSNVFIFPISESAASLFQFFFSSSFFIVIFCGHFSSFANFAFSILLFSKDKHSNQDD